MESTDKRLLDLDNTILEHITFSKPLPSKSYRSPYGIKCKKIEPFQQSVNEYTITASGGKTVTSVDKDKSDCVEIDDDRPEDSEAILFSETADITLNDFFKCSQFENFVNIIENGEENRDSRNPPAQIIQDQEIEMELEFEDDLGDLDDIFKTQYDIDYAAAPSCHSQKTHQIKEKQTCEKDTFFGLPMKVKHLLREYRGIEKLYDWQTECLNSRCVQNRRNLIYAIPTSGGKTLVAEILMLKEIICRKRNVLFILPYVSIVREKICSLSNFALDLNFLLEEYASGQGSCPPRKKRNKNSIFIATIEKSLSLIDSLIEADRANEIGLVVVDELHLIGDQGRGAILETVLSKIMYLKAGIQIVGMSATIGNMPEIGQFLEAEIFMKDFRPVDLVEYVKCGPDIYQINTVSEEVFEPYRTVDYGYTSVETRLDPDHIGGLVMEVVPTNACLIFCPTKKNCENVTILLTKVLPKDLIDYKMEEKTDILKMLFQLTGRVDVTLMQTIPYGVAFHHAGLTLDERKILEDAYRAGTLCVLCCTSTLAAGVNLPAKRVILRSPYVGFNFITLSCYKQMVGRAGRAGLGEIGESILIVQPKDKHSVVKLLYSPMDEAISSMHRNDAVGLENLILSAIGLNLAVSCTDLYDLVSYTLLYVQAGRLNIKVRDCVKEIIGRFFKMRALSVRTQTLSEDMSVRILTQHQDIEPTQSSNKCIIKTTTPLEISTLGKAAFKSCVDLAKAQELFDDLRMAQKAVVLLDYLHLLYIVTPPDQDNIFPDSTIYYNEYVRLSPNQLHTAHTIGISEVLATQLMTGKSIKHDQQRILKRFFVTLILQDLWNLKSVFDVSEKFHVNRGFVQQLTSSAAAYAASVTRFCEELEEFWAFSQLLKVMANRLGHCCSAELMPLMELPAVRMGRAKQLYAAGYKTIELIAKAQPSDMVGAIQYLSYQSARQIISAAQIKLVEKIENLNAEAQEMMEIIRPIKK